MKIKICFFGVLLATLIYAGPSLAGGVARPSQICNELDESGFGEAARACPSIVGRYSYFQPKAFDVCRKLGTADLCPFCGGLANDCVDSVGDNDFQNAAVEPCDQMVEQGFMRASGICVKGTANKRYAPNDVRDCTDLLEQGFVNQANRCLQTRGY